MFQKHCQQRRQLTVFDEQPSIHRAQQRKGSLSFNLKLSRASVFFLLATSRRGESVTLNPDQPPKKATIFNMPFQWPLNGGASNLVEVVQRNAFRSLMNNVLRIIDPVLSDLEHSGILEILLRSSEVSESSRSSKISLEIFQLTGPHKSNKPESNSDLNNCDELEKLLMKEQY